MKALLQNPWVAIPVRFALGCIFMFSAWPKIVDPPAFAQMVANYKLLPEAMISPVAIALPWLEMATGAALVFGVLRRGASLWIAVMLVVFIVALSTNIARGIAVDCGCFSVTASQKSPEELMAAMKLDIVRDLGMFVMALFTFLTPVGWRRRGASGA